MEPYCPGSWLVLEHKSTKDVPMICIGYKYSRSKVSTFLMTRGCGNTTSGRLYRMHCVREDGFRYHKDVGRPEVVTNYYNACGVIDHHNHSHQGTLALEEKWPTRDGWNRIFVTMCGLVLTDSWLGFKHFLGSQFGKRNKHPLWNITVCEFSELVASKILSRHSRTRWNYGVDDIPQLECGSMPCPDDSENISSPRESDAGTTNDSSEPSGVHARGKHRCGPRQSHCGGTDKARVGTTSSISTGNSTTLGPVGESVDLSSNPRSLSSITVGSTTVTEESNICLPCAGPDLAPGESIEYTNDATG